MGADSKIEWTHHTFNPWHGCVKVSPGCANCYAEAFDRRTHGTSKHVTDSGETREPHWGKDAPRRFFGDKHWAEPLKWNRDAEKAGERRRVFCASMADVFEDRPDLIEPRARLAALICDTPNLYWLLLTKRPENVRDLWWAAYGEAASLPPNVWLGTTCEDQQRADERIPHLLAVPAAVRFLSVEPMLGPVDLAKAGAMGLIVHDDGSATDFGAPPSVDWVIVGGESGAVARSFDPAWAYGIVDECQAAGVACFVKQMGSNPVVGTHYVENGRRSWSRDISIRDPKGGDMAEWPLDLRVREFPKAKKEAR